MTENTPQPEGLFGEGGPESAAINARTDAALGVFVDIIAFESSETVKSLGPYPDTRTAEKADRGVQYQMDHERFYTQIRNEGAPA